MGLWLWAFGYETLVVGLWLWDFGYEILVVLTRGSGEVRAHTKPWHIRII